MRARPIMALLAAGVFGGGAGLVTEALNPSQARAQYCEHNYCTQSTSGYLYCDWIYVAANCDAYYSGGALRCTTRSCPAE